MGWLLINFIPTVLMSISAYSHDHHGPKLLETHNFLREPMIPEECLDKKYCENVPNYPKELAAKLIAKLQRRYIEKFNLNSSITQKNEEIASLCTVNKTIVAPKAAKDSRGRWHFILNHQTYPLQLFEAVECRKGLHNRPGNCAEKYIFISGASTVCQQKYTSVYLVTISPFGNVSNKKFDIPCCCSCEADKKT